MDARLAVVSVSFGSSFPGLVYAQLRKHEQPGRLELESTTVKRYDPEFRRARLLGLLEGATRPTALIALCIRLDRETIDRFRAARVPVVLVDEEAEGASTVACDNRAGGYLAGQHLARAGRRRIAVVCGRRDETEGFNALQRVMGFEAALAERGLALASEDVVEVVEYSRADGKNALAALLDRRRPIDAVFCAAGDACAAGMLATARERGVKVPEQLAILGYDDNPLASLTDPPLSTVRQPLEKIADQVFRLATERSTEILAEPKTIVFSPELVLRATA